MIGEAPAIPVVRDESVGLKPSAAPLESVIMHPAPSLTYRIMPVESGASTSPFRDVSIPPFGILCFVAKVLMSRPRRSHLGPVHPFNSLYHQSFTTVSIDRIFSVPG